MSMRATGGRILWLRSYGIPVREGLQQAGDVIVLRGGTLHWVVCDDLPSVHSSWNFGVQCAETFEAALESCVERRHKVPEHHRCEVAVAGSRGASG